MQRVAIYVRVSTTEQAMEGYSISAQISLLKTYAEIYKHVIFKIYQDAGISGKNIEDRPALLKLLEDAKQDKFDIVLIWKLSRLSRSLLDLLSVVNILKQHNISLLSYTEHFDTSTPIGKMLLQLLGSIAEFERNTIIENVKMGMNERFKQGLSKSSIPFGYYYEGRKICVDEKKAAAVKEIFTRYAAGSNVTTLVDYLNSLGLKNRLNKPWRYEVVLRMLQNEFYTGYVTTGRKDLKNSRFETCKGVHEPIISEELFSEAQRRISNNKKSAYVRKPDADQLLSGIVICPICGNGMYYIESWSSRKDKRYYSVQYRCSASNPNRRQCKGFSISKKKVDDHVLKKLEFVIDVDIVGKIAEAARSINERDSLQEKFSAIKGNLNEAVKVRDRYFNLFETGKVDMETFADRVNELILKINSLEEQKEVIESELYAESIDLSDALKDLKSFTHIYQFFTPQERRETVRTLIRRVQVTADRKIGEIEFVGGFIL